MTAATSIDGTDGFSYDAAGQVIAATHSYQANESYSFDSNGNRTNTGYTTGTNNQLSSDGTYNYTYDNAGNLTKKTTIATGNYVTYTWDYHNRLTDVQAYNSSNVLQSHEHYVYDVFDRLIERQVDPTGGGTYTASQSFVYEGDNVILVYNGSGTLTDRMLNGPGSNNALADENASGTVSWLLADNEGTIRDVVQYNSGTNTTTIVDHLEYNSFGVITSQSNSANQPLFTYTGQMWDSATGLYFYHARWYDPSTGRFISQDPTGFAAGDPNLYRYVGNSPTNSIDPTGNDATAPMIAQMQQNQAAQQAAMAQPQQAATMPPGIQGSAPTTKTPPKTDPSITPKGPPVTDGPEDGPHTVTTEMQDGSIVTENFPGPGKGDPTVVVQRKDGRIQIRYPDATVVNIDPKKNTVQIWYPPDKKGRRVGLTYNGIPPGFAPKDPTKPPDQSRLPPDPTRRPPEIEGEAENVKNPPGPLPEVDLKILVKIWDKFKLVFVLTIDQEGKPTGGVFGGQLDF